LAIPFSHDRIFDFQIIASLHVVPGFSMTTETDGGPDGSVLEHEFCTNPKSYFTTSYPHPIEEAARTDIRKKR
jgi:hypothetical protein